MTIREIFNFILDFPIGYVIAGIIALGLIGLFFEKIESLGDDMQDEGKTFKSKFFAFLKICALCLVAILVLAFTEPFWPQHWKFWE